MVFKHILAVVLFGCVFLLQAYLYTESQNKVLPCETYIDFVWLSMIVMWGSLVLLLLSLVLGWELKALRYTIIVTLVTLISYVLYLKIVDSQRTSVANDLKSNNSKVEYVSKELEKTEKRSFGSEKLC